MIMKIKEYYLVTPMLSNNDYYWYDVYFFLEIANKSEDVKLDQITCFHIERLKEKQKVLQ